MSNILITSAGRRVSLVKAFQKELKALFGADAKVLTTDLDPTMSAACRISDGGFEVGYFQDDDYIDRLLDICVSNQVAMVIPTLDTELEVLCRSKDRFASKGVHIVISDLAFIKACRDKRLINEFFDQRGFLLPRAVDKRNPTFPLFIKPIDGSSSQNLHIINHPDEISVALLKDEKLIWMEYLDQKDFVEFTIDLYYDKSSTLQCVVPRVRIAVRGGETNKGITKKDQVLLDMIKDKLGKIEGARGCLTLQVFKSKATDNIYGIEINPRFGGGFPLTYLSGANYPKWLLQEYLHGQAIPFFDAWQQDKLLLRYDFEYTVDNFEYSIS